MPPDGYKPNGIVPDHNGVGDCRTWGGVNNITNYVAEATLDESPISDSDLKIEVNNLVWMHGPAAMTLGEAEKLACQIFELLVDAREKHAT